MRISQLIEELTKMREMHGDLYVATLVSELEVGEVLPFVNQQIYDIRMDGSYVDFIGLYHTEKRTWEEDSCCGK